MSDSGRRGWAKNQDTSVPLALTVTQSECLPLPEAEVFFLKKDYEYITLFSHYHKYFQQSL